jgi:amino acid adenylation domain-containing protein
MPQPSPSFEKQGSNSTQRPMPPAGCVPELVAQRAAATPDAIAAVQEGASLTYRELDERAGQLAHHLRRLGVGPDVVVGLCIQRSVAMIIGALGIMKAGGAYLPIDSAYPSNRRESILDDARAAVLISAQYGEEEQTRGSWQAIELDSQGRLATQPPDETFCCRIEPHHLAYLIYTSGSTGQPKGVEVTHGSLLNLIFWHQTAFGVTSADRASQLSSVGFDAAVWELWPYLTAGASINIPGENLLTSPASLRDWLLDQRITICFVPTPVAERAMALEWPTKAAMRFMLTGADVLRRYPPAHLPFCLVNNYGPTECTVVATSGIVPPDACPDSLPTIGRPIANTQIHILNENLRPVPVGTVGEIYIGGACVARGYRHRPDLTAERFISDPFSPGCRLYKTGDRARYLANGEIAFCGRSDDQIKIRGFRIETNEIVAALAKHPSVRECFVIAREVTADDKQLVAYVVPAPKALPTHATLRSFLATHLPEYMIPASFVQLEALPVNTNGKIDRNALPAPDSTNSLRDDVYVAPRTAIEQQVAEIVAHLLHLDRLGVEDNFFLLGGHSLLGTQLIGRVRDAFGVELSLRTVFDASTISQLSAEVEKLLLAKIDSMTEEEAHEMLNAAQQDHLQENAP